MLKEQSISNGHSNFLKKIYMAVAESPGWNCPCQSKLAALVKKAKSEIEHLSVFNKPTKQVAEKLRELKETNQHAAK